MWDWHYAALGLAASLAGGIAGLFLGIGIQHVTGMFDRFREDYAGGFYAGVVTFVACPAALIGAVDAPRRILSGESWHQVCFWHLVLTCAVVALVTNVGPFFGFYK